MKHVVAVVANMAGVLLCMFSLLLLEGAGELIVEGNADSSATLILFPLAALAGALAIGLLLGPGRPCCSGPHAQYGMRVQDALSGLCPKLFPAGGIKGLHCALLSRVVPPVGLEPTTFGLKVRSSDQLS